MQSLVITIIMFGVAGAILLAAVFGLLVLAAIRQAPVGMRALLSVGFGVVPIAVSGVAVLTLWESDPHASFVRALLTAFIVVLLAYAINFPVVSLLMRRFDTVRAAAHSRRFAPTVLVSGIVLSALFGFCGAGAGYLLS